MQVERAWRDYVAASQRFAAVSDRLRDRLRFFTGDPPSVPRLLSASDIAAWLGLTIEVEQAASVQRRALEDYISARDAGG